MVYGLRGQLGERVLCHVVEERKIGLDHVLTQHHNTVDHNVQGRLQQLNNVIHKFASVSMLIYFFCCIRLCVSFFTRLTKVDEIIQNSSKVTR